MSKNQNLYKMGQNHGEYNPVLCYAAGCSLNNINIDEDGALGAKMVTYSGVRVDWWLNHPDLNLLLLVENRDVAARRLAIENLEPKRFARCFRN